MWDSIKDFVWACVGAFVGLILGVWYSVCSDDEKREKEVRYLKLRLIAALEFNIEKVKQMLVDIGLNTSDNKMWIPSFTLAPDMISHILFHGTPFLNESFFGRFNKQRYELTHINEKLSILKSVANHGDMNAALEILSGLEVHLDLTLNEIQLLLEEYKKYS